MGLERKIVDADLCVIGGGMAGVCAAVTAARRGMKVALIHERPVLGGNASGEIRMWICGAQQYEYREAGLQEELNLENYYYNATKNWYLFDAILYNKVAKEKNITAFLNCTCYDAETENGVIKSITAYQMTTQTQIVVRAGCYADCSGDSILAPLTGAEYMYGREGMQEYGEHMMRSHNGHDRKTMGNSVLIQARRVDHPVKFVAPDWAEKVSVEKLKSKNVCLENTEENFWYIELGGNEDVVANAEQLNRRLLALCLGVWDTIKNSGAFDADCYDLEFLGFLPAKRESRRMTGDYVMTANDILDGGKFADTVAYGGWCLDDHNPDGFDGDESNYTTAVDHIYGIPYRCLYSHNIKNLFFAGRNISLTHMAMSSARVMGTCGTIGQAVGNAAYLATKYGISPREVGQHMEELQQNLLWDDCYLPQVERKVSELSRTASLFLKNSPENLDALRNGRDRDADGESNAAAIPNGEDLVYDFGCEREVREVKIVFDSDLIRAGFGDMDRVEKTHLTRCNILKDSPVMFVPGTLAKAFSVVGVKENGERDVLFETELNLTRNVAVKVNGCYRQICLRIASNFGGTSATRVFTFEVL